jgi:uncharacterized membrane protein
MTPTQQVTAQQVARSITGPTTSARVAGVLHKVALPTVLLNVVAPFAAYQVLTAHGVSEVNALSVASVFPLAAVITAAVHSRRLEWIGVLSVASIALGLASALILHDPHVLLVKDSLITGALGLAFLGSLLARWPLTFVFARQFAPGTAPGFRARMRRMTVVWGLGMLGEATVRVILAFLICPWHAAGDLPVARCRLLRTLVAWTLYRRRHANS